MAANDAIITKELEHLRSLTSSDFIALAPLRDEVNRISWKFAVGSTNERYRLMVLKIGQGLAGTALRLGRPINFDYTTTNAEQMRQDCPVMLAEQLQTAAVFPVLSNPNSIIKGLLFIGKRTRTNYIEDEIQAVHKKLQVLAWYLEENTEEIVK